MLTTSQALTLAVRHHQAGELESAEKIYRAVLRVDPKHAGVHYNLGSILQKQDRIAEAVQCYRRAVTFAPSDAMSYRALGTALKARGELQQAVECFQKALTLQPEYAEAHNNLANLLLDDGNVAAAIENYRAACRIRPDSADFQFNLGNAWMQSGEFVQAEASFRRAVELNPGHPNSLNSLGIALFDQGRVSESLNCYEAALRLDSEHGRSHYNRALAWLIMGDWNRGWREYEWRWRARSEHAPPTKSPRWNGDPQPESTLLIEAEQGLGDTIQFVRFTALAKQKVGRVVLRCQRPLIPLLEGVAGIDAIFADDDPPTSCDLWSPLMSLPGLLGTEITTIPGASNLGVKPQLVERWRTELNRFPGLRIGVQWQGNPEHLKDRFRSFPLQHFGSLAELDGVQLISLQKGTGREQLDKVRFPILDLGARLDLHSEPFMDTAAVMKSLDLVITCDTSIGHLAGTLGVPTWIPLSTVPEWRWLLDREDTPWYPSVRLFRQSRQDDWDEVFQRVRGALQELLQRKAARLEGGTV